MDPNNYNIEEICTVSNDQELASIIQNTDDNCTIIIVDENNNFQFTDSTVNNIFETNLNESFDLNEEHSTEHIYANVQILNPTTSSTCSNELQSDSTDNFIYTAVALPNENKTIASRNAEEIDEDPSHQGEGNGNNTTRKQNVKNTEEQNEDTIEEQNVETNENDETMRGRKRKRQSELWKQNLRKRRRQSGMEYVNTRGKTQRKREVKQGTKDCKGGCRKLNVFNLTGHFSLNKCAYNAIWPEHIAGRGANEISSALLKILEKVLEDFPSLETITLWSDSCIPQNRNSIVISALQHFMRSDRSYSLKSVEQKFSEPGHSSIQEVDCVHSHIEKALNLSEIFSPVSFLRILTKVRKRSMKVIQLQPEHFFDFQTASRTFKYNSVPFTKVKYLKLEVEKPLHVLYKVSFSDESFKEVSIVAQNTRKKQKTVVMPKVNMLTKSNLLSKEKVKDLKDMLKYMPLDDRKYYETVFKSYK
ncbi:unnamed protein product [Mytilus edulis]|uniref:Uncharacterized protein n=1 Tax=Mytilus edulis TaxID=6550 RepID=A0A8S3SKE5_MYTED|nr:unnamed protein product [Mytilus edulis]